jgi:hypothetical protein
MLIGQTCGYPASEDACAKGWAALSREVGITADAIVAAPKAKLLRAMRAGGIVLELRAERLVAIASRVKEGADLRSRKVLKTFPTIGDPVADHILLFTRVEPIAAVPSNAVQVPFRLRSKPLMPSCRAKSRPGSARTSFCGATACGATAKLSASARASMRSLPRGA